MERTCKKCGETKPIEEFVKKKACKYGFAYDCKKCRNISINEWCKNNKQKRQEIHRRSYKKNRKHAIDYYIENKTGILKRIKNWYENNKNEILRRGKDYRESNIDIIHKRQNDYRERNRDKIHKKDIIDLSTTYVVKRIKLNTGLSCYIIRQHPELIENYRNQYKLKRLLKSKKNESTKTS